MPNKFFENKLPLKPKLEVWDNTVKGLTSFKNHFHPKDDVIYYPSCGTDISVTKVFTESRVIFLDGEHITKDLSAEGFEAHVGFSETFTPDAPVDILLLINPMINPDKPFEVLREDGFLVCNNYHHTATLVKDRPDFILKAVILDNGQISTDNLEECWEDIDTTEDFEKSPIYTRAERIVEQLTGKKENILDEYKKILESSEDGGIMINGKYTPLFNLPKKKHASLFIFEKK